MRADGAWLCILFSCRHRPSGELWTPLIPGGTMPAATGLCPDPRGSGWTLRGASPQQGEGRRAIKSLMKGRQLSEGGREASLTDQKACAWYFHHTCQSTFRAL